MKILISGNPNFGLAQALHKMYPDATFCSRRNEYELTNKQGRQEFAQLAVLCDVIIVNAALWQFQQTVLLDTVYKALVEAKKQAHIVVIGSTTDRVKNGKAWLYNAEKKALRDYSNTLGLTGVWASGPKITYISFGTLSNNQKKHPDRKCMNIDTAAEYIKWIVEQPKHLNINELSIDPMQPEMRYEKDT